MLVARELLHRGWLKRGLRTTAKWKKPMECSFILYVSGGKYWPTSVPWEPVSTTEEVRGHQGGRTWLNTSRWRKGRESQKKKKKEEMEGWKVRRSCSFQCGNYIGVLSSESTFEVEFCVTFLKVFRCNTFSSFVIPSLKWCVKMPENHIFS